MKVREFVLVPSYKLKALEEAGAESVHEHKQDGKHQNKELSTKEDQTARNISESEFKEEPSESSDKQTNVLGETEENEKNGLRRKRGGGASLDERRKRLRKLWLNL